MGRRSRMQSIPNTSEAYPAPHILRANIVLLLHFQIHDQWYDHSSGFCVVPALFHLLLQHVFSSSKNAVESVQAAVQYIKARMMYQKLPLTIMGFSLGAATAVNAASTIPEIDALIACAPFSRWDYVCTEWIIQRGCPEFIATCLRPCIMVHGRIKFGSDFFKYQPVNTLPLIKEKPAFFIHSTGDKTVLFENHNRLRRVYHGHNAIFWKRPIEDHYVTDRKNFMKPWLDVEYKQRLLKFLHEVQAQHHAKILASIPNHYQEYEQD